MADLIGTSIGKYRIESVLGQGGMGTVYLAQDEDGGQAALKVLEEGPGVSKDALERFQRESQASKALRDHPNIITVFDSGFECIDFIFNSLPVGSHPTLPCRPATG